MHPPPTFFKNVSVYLYLFIYFILFVSTEISQIKIYCIDHPCPSLGGAALGGGGIGMGHKKNKFYRFCKRIFSMATSAE